MPATNIFVYGATNAVYLQMNGNSLQYSIGSLTSPSTWTTIVSANWPINVVNLSASSFIMLNVYFYDDITLTFTYSSTSVNNTYFRCLSNYITFNGNNKNLSIINYLLFNGCIFSDSKSNIVVKNIISTNNTGSTLYSNSSYYGGIGAGWICQANYGNVGSNNIIENCHHTGSVATANYTGYIVGWGVGSSGGSVEIIGCTNTANITGYGGGGIAGSLAGADGGSVTFINCSNSGSIIQDAGGIAGQYAGANYSSGFSVGGSATFINCINSGSLTGEGSGGIAGQYAGAQYLSITPVGTATFESCSNTGDLSVPNVGGIAGRKGGYAGNINFTECINNAYFIGRNTGGISGTDTCGAGGIGTFIGCSNIKPVSSYYCGGMVGNNSGNNGGTLTFTDCINDGSGGNITNSGGFVARESCNTNSTLTFTNCTNYGRTEYSSGAFVAENCLKNNSTLTMTNCTNNGNISGKGMCAFTGDSTSIINITNCTNNGNIEEGNTGGIIAGFAYGSITLTNCTNNGRVGPTSATNGSAGGLVGAYSRATTLNIINCVNTGQITYLEGGGIVGGYMRAQTLNITGCRNTGVIAGTAGGIVGSKSPENIAGDTIKYMTITNCTNNGNLTGSGSGGIVGANSGWGAGGANGTNVVNITKCTNNGNVQGNGGGIIGASASYGLSECYITSCVNTGTISGSGGGGIAGHFAGYMSPDANPSKLPMVISCCANTGTLSGEQGGGMVGYSARNVHLKKCYSTGNITGQGAGGITGGGFGRYPARNGNANVTDCYSTGNISALYAGGVFGGGAALDVYGLGSATYTMDISGCYSLGSMVANASGIASSCVNSNLVTMRNCYSYGTYITAGAGIVLNVQPSTISNTYAANGTWSDTTANANLTSTPSGTGIENGQATRWTSMSTDTPYLLSSYFSLTGSNTCELVPQTYTPNSVSTFNNGDSPAGLYQPAQYTFVSSIQTGNTSALIIYVIAGTSPLYYSYGYATYNITNLNGGTGRAITATINGTTGVISYILPYPCFLEGSKILCFENNKEIYRPVEKLRKGDLVKTIYNGYLPIHMIGTSTMYNPNNDDRIASRLYRCSKENYPDLFEDLYITGCHSILVPWLTEVQGLITKATLGKLYVTDKHCRLMAWVDEKAEPYRNGGIYNIYHIALENEDYFMNYGIYANGLLVESCSKRYLMEMSCMKIVGEENSSVLEDDIENKRENVFSKITELVESK